MMTDLSALKILNTVAGTLVYVCKSVEGGQDESAFQLHTNDNPRLANFQSKSSLSETDHEQKTKEEGHILRISFQVLGIAAFAIVVIIIIFGAVKYLVCRSPCASSTRPETVTPKRVQNRTKERSVYVDPENIQNSLYTNSPTMSSTHGVSTSRY